MSQLRKRATNPTRKAALQHEDRTTQTSRERAGGLHTERGVSYRPADEAAVRRAAKQRVSAAAISVASKGRLTISEMPAAIKVLASISSIDAVASRMGRSEAALQSEAAQASADFSGGRPPITIASN